MSTFLDINEKVFAIFGVLFGVCVTLLFILSPFRICPKFVVWGILISTPLVMISTIIIFVAVYILKVEVKDGKQSG